MFTVDEANDDQKEDHIDSPDTETVIDTGMPKGLVLKLLIAPVLFYYIIQWMKLIMMSTMVILLKLRLYLVCICILCINNNMQLINS